MTMGAYFAGGARSDGAYNYVDLEGFKVGGTCSFEAYVRYDDSGYYARVFDFGDGQADDNIFLTRSGRSTDLQFELQTGTSYTGHIDDGTITDGQFTHLIATVTSGCLLYTSPSPRDS